MNELKIFENAEFGQIRTVQLNNEIYFVGKDITESLGYMNASKALVDHVDGEDKLYNESLSSLGQRGGWLINESGLYALILSSKLESAKRFKRWVTGEVLPSIRKTGSYEKPKTAMELMELQFEAIREVNSKVDDINEDLQLFKQDMPILGIEESRITSAVKKKGVHCLGGKESEAYQEKSLRGKVYADIYGQLKREFGVASYKAIKRNQCDQAVSIISNYELPIVLMEAVEGYNSQMSFV